jgi:Flp pilus assembly pilin Flp
MPQLAVRSGIWGFVRAELWNPRDIRQGREAFERKGARMKALLAKFAREERGMETVEWAILAALIVAGLVTVISTLGSNVLARFTTLQNATT